MTTPVHMISASLIALKAANVAPHQLDYIWMAILFSGIVDLDHLYFIVRDFKHYQKHGFSGQLHHARSIYHELLGVMIWSVVTLFIYFFDKTLASLFFISIMVHLSQDFLTGTSMPFSPFDNKEMKLFKFTFKNKVIINIIIVVLSIILWLLYLNGKL
jgi:LexA-binding, inner membrane-associated putative hydrolase